VTFVAPRGSPGDWTDAAADDPGVALIELLAYVGEILSSYQEQVAAEAQLRTRRRYALALAAFGALAVLVICRRRRAGDTDDD
jgi:hypothetical protein